MKKKKYYVVWQGWQTGIFYSWDECQKSVDKYPQAKYKSFENYEEAVSALNGVYHNFLNRKEPKKQLTEAELFKIGFPIRESICVDGAWNTRNGLVEYRGVDYFTGNELFKQGPYEDGTNNIVEFLAIVHALGYCKRIGLNTPIYSDSRNAINWVKNKVARTNHPRSSKNEELFALLDRAVKWLKENSYPNKILKWETKAWGENPADFGRK